MKKVPVPATYIVPDTDGTNRTVVHFEWETFSLQMYEDQALLMARSIYDVLEVPPGWMSGQSPWEGL
jgi:hypothetical protein